MSHSTHLHSAAIAGMKPMNEPLTFAEWLKARRKSLDLTQNELAARASCSPVTVKKIEAGDLRPSRQLAELLADALGTAADQREDFVRFARAGSGDFASDAFSPSSGAAPHAATPDASKPTVRPFNNLPAQLTALLGREHEVAGALRMLRQPGVRLLTLTGPPGAGKTRLSIEIAEALAGDFGDGVCFVALAPVTDPALVAPTIAQTLGLSESSGINLVTAVKQFLAPRALLLVLDNFEQVIAAAPAVKDLLMAAANLKVIVTSREVLHLYGEREFPVPPLTLPDVNRLPPVEALALYPAIELFVDRACAVQPSFELTSANADPVARICAWLDGLPLAIEMAAAQVRWMSPERVLQQITSQLAALTGGPRNLSPRQQTMRGAIEWSYNLLDPAERTLFVSLAVFAGGFTLDAAQHVTGGLDAERVQEMLFGLVEKSLVHHEQDAAGEMRFLQLEVIRSYASELLTADATHLLVHRRHADHYRRLVQESMRWINTAEQPRWLARLDAEQNNLRTALEWFLRHDPPIALRMSVELARDYLALRGQYSEGRAWLARCMEVAATSHEWRDSDDMSWALALDGRLAAALGDGDVGQQRSLVSLERFRAAGSASGCAVALRTLARIAVTRSNYQEATNYYEQALPLSLAAGDQHEAAQIYNGLGFIAKNRGDYTGALAWYEKALACYAALGSRAGEAHTLTLISIAHYWQGRFALAAEMGERCVQMRRELGNTYGTAFALDLWGMALARSGDFSAGMEALQEALEFFQRMGDKAGVALVLNDLGQVAHLQGDFHQAVQLHQRAYHHAAAIGEKYRMAFCLEGIALALAELVTDDERNGWLAVRLLAAASGLRQEIGSPTPPSEKPLHDAALARLHSVLTDERFAACWSEGVQMTLDAAEMDALLNSS